MESTRVDTAGAGAHDALSSGPAMGSELIIEESVPAFRRPGVDGRARTRVDGETRCHRLTRGSDERRARTR